jgi:hypothetical protein
MLKKAVQQGREANDERGTMSDGQTTSQFPRSALIAHRSAFLDWRTFSAS